MPYYLYKLNYTTPVRFGIDKASSNLSTTAFTSNADTLFSAICNEWVRIFGEEDLEDFVSISREGSFLVSDLLPYRNILGKNGATIDCEIYMPKPVIMVERDNHSLDTRGDSVSKKKLKKTTHICIGKLEEYFRFLKSGGDINFAMDKDMIFVEEDNIRTAIAYCPETLPYQVASVRFFKDAGLCFIAKMNKDIKDKFDIVVDSLSTTGIGGKRSSGYGKFNLDEDAIEISKDIPIYESHRKLAEMLSTSGNFNISLSCMVPKDDEINALSDGKSYYQLILRKGFIYSRTYSKANVKRKQIVMLKAGACLSKALEGSIVELSSGGNHKVYRYGKAMYLGVNI